MRDVNTFTETVICYSSYVIGTVIIVVFLEVWTWKAKSRISEKNTFCNYMSTYLWTINMIKEVVISANTLFLLQEKGFPRLFFCADILALCTCFLFLKYSLLAAIFSSSLLVWGFLDMTPCVFSPPWRFSFWHSLYLLILSRACAFWISFFSSDRFFLYSLNLCCSSNLCNTYNSGFCFHLARYLRIPAAALLVLEITSGPFSFLGRFLSPPGRSMERSLNLRRPAIISEKSK